MNKKRVVFAVMNSTEAVVKMKPQKSLGLHGS